MDGLVIACTTFRASGLHSFPKPLYTPARPLKTKVYQFKSIHNTGWCMSHDQLEGIHSLSFLHGAWLDVLVVTLIKRALSHQIGMLSL